MKNRREIIYFILYHYFFIVAIPILTIFILILFNTNEIELFYFDFSEKGFAHFVNIFKVPLSLVGLSIPLYGILLALYRMYQTEEIMLFNQKVFESNYRPLVTCGESTINAENMIVSLQVVINLSLKNSGEIPAKIIKIDVNVENAENGNKYNLSILVNRNEQALILPNSTAVVLNEIFKPANSVAIEDEYSKYSILNIEITYQGYSERNYKTILQFKKEESNNYFHLYNTLWE